MKDNKKRMVQYLAAYILAFGSAFLLSYSPFLMAGKSFIISGDGREQNYPVLIYIGQQLRRMAVGILRGSFEFPMFNLGVGMGGDVISTLTYHGLTDPLNAVSMIVPTRYTEGLFNFLCIFRCFLAGLSFSVLCQYYKKDLSYTLLGSIIYTFSGWTIYTAVRHPWMINPMIQLPLILVGADMIINGRRLFVFVLSVCYSALCGFYGLYIMTILTGLYVLAYIAVYHKKYSPRVWTVAIGRLAAAYVWGIGMSAVSFIPSVIGIFTSSRAGSTNERNLLSYGLSYYKNTLISLISPPGSWDTFSLAAIVLPVFVLLFICTRKKLMKTLTIIAAILYLVPLGGYIMNGFAYPVQRWTFAVALLASLALVELFPILLNLDPKQKRMCMAVLMLFTVYGLTVNRTVYCLIGCLMLAITTAVLFWINDSQSFVLQEKNRKRYRVMICLFVIIGNVGINACYRFMPEGANYISNFTDYGTETTRLFQTPEKLLETLSDKQSGRIESSSFSYNEGLVFQLPSDYSYWSLTNGNVVDFWEKTESISQRAMKFRIGGTDQRTILSTLFSTKYFAESKKRTQYLPFGYQWVGSLSDNYDLYENIYALPWGYTYDSYITYDELNNLNGLEYENALMQSIALEKEVNDISHGSIRSNVREIPFKIAETKDLSLENGILKVTKANATMTLEFAPIVNQELYVRILGLDINNSGYSEIVFNIKTDEINKNAGTASTLFNVYSQRNNYLFNLNYSEKERNSCTFVWPKTGTFKLEDIQLYSMPMDDYIVHIESLRREPLEHIVWGTNSLRGDINLSQNKVLCISIPYSSGWKAKVDGKSTEILRGNTMFMAIPLTAGFHEIVLNYTTPGLVPGIVISVISFLLFLYFILRRKPQFLLRLFHRQLFRFLLIGGVTTVIDFVIYSILGQIIHIVPAKLCSMLCSTFFAFLVNRNWTFGYREEGWLISLRKYYLAQAANITVNVSVNTLLFLAFQQRLIAFGAATLAGMTVNFLLQKNYVFKTKGE